jgi:hypothetical protein
MEEWCKMQDELEAKGWKVDPDRFWFPNGRPSQRFPEHWTTEQCVRHTYAYVKNLRVKQFKANAVGR